MTSAVIFPFFLLTLAIFLHFPLVVPALFFPVIPASPLLAMLAPDIFRSEMATTVMIPVAVIITIFPIPV